MRQYELQSISVWRIAVVVVMAAALAGGLVLGAASQAVAQDGPTFTTQARFLHADTDGGEYEVHINGDEVLDEFSYGDESDWIDLDPGTVRLTITADRIGFNYVVFDAVYPVAAGNSFNVIISDALVIGSAIDGSDIREGDGRVKVVHASADTPAVDIVVSGSDDALATELGYGRSSEYVDVPAGSYDLDLLVSDSGEVALSVPGLTIDPGMVYDLVIMGTAGNDDHPLTVAPLATSAGGDDMATPAS